MTRRARRDVLHFNRSREGALDSGAERVQRHATTAGDVHHLSRHLAGGVRGEQVRAAWGPRTKGLLLGGAFITETLFGLPGIGQLAVTSIGTNDFPMVMGVTVLGALFIAVANLIVDIAYAVLDPRVRYT